jgi:type II secretion system protein L
MARILGLDVGTTAVRGAVLRTALRKVELERYVEAPLAPAEPGAPEGPAGRADALASAIRQVLAAVGKAPDGIVVAIAGEDASVRPVELPAAAQKRIAEVLPFELEAVLPFPAEDAVIDYQPIDKDGARVRLLAAAAPRANVASLLAELGDAGVAPQEIAVGAAALDGLVGLVPELAGAGPYVVLDLGAHHLDINILHHGRTEIARTVGAGIAGLPQNEGELTRALVQTLASFRAAGAPAPIKAFVCGGGALLEGLGPWLGRLLGEAEVVTLSLPPAPGADDVTRPLFARATALAGRTLLKGKRLDLRQGEFAQRRAMGALRAQLPLLAACAGAVVFAFVFSTWSSYRLLGERRQTLETELARVTLDAFGEATRDPERAKRLLDGRTGAQDPLPRFDAFDALDAISRAVPGDVVHDTRRLEISIGTGEREGKLELQGTVSNIAERDRVVEALGANACFHDIENGRTSPAVGQDRVTYTIAAVINCGTRPAPTKNRTRSRASE